MTIIDIKGDPVGQDMKLRENRVAVLKDLSDMKYTVVIAAHPCTTYGHCIGVQMSQRQEQGHDLGPDGARAEHHGAGQGAQHP